MALLRNLWKNKHSLQSEASLLTAFLYNTRVPDSLTHQMISPWLVKNLFHFGHLVEPVTRTLLSFEDLRGKNDLPHRAFFGYLQKSHYVLSFAPSLQFFKLTPFEWIVLSGPSQKGLVSYIYRILNEYNIDTQGKHGYMLR